MDACNTDIPAVQQKELPAPADKALVDLPPVQLIERALQNSEACLASNGALVVNTGKRTGRSPHDRFLVRDATTADTVAWGDVNQAVDGEVFAALWQRVGDYLQRREHYVAHLHVGAHSDRYLPLRVSTETAWHNLFARNMFIQPEKYNPLEKAPWEVLSAPRFHCQPKRDGTRSDAAVMIDFTQRRVLLAGMWYAGELKKSMFTVQNFLFPEDGILPMHCAANIGSNGDVSLFFGLSGTGKTTLSADAERYLIGDDEHAWDSGSVFNLEGGCYAKCYRLSRRYEPVIWDAIRFGAIIENVIIDAHTRAPNFDDASRTENSRCCYPRTHIPLRSPDNQGGEPQNVIFLTCDVNGVVPPVSILSAEAAAYHFLSGYTALLASTEGGAGAIKATFSNCFGAPFFPRPAEVYAKLLMKRIRAFNSRVYLVSTGWTGGTGGAEGTGERFSISTTRTIVRAIQEGRLEDAATQRIKPLNLDIPRAVPGVDSAILNPRDTWHSPAAYDRQARSLTQEFQKNFRRFSVGAEIRRAGPGA